MILTSVTSCQFAMICFIKTHMTLELNRPHYIQIILLGQFITLVLKVLNVFRTEKSVFVTASEVFPSGRINASPLLQNAKCTGC